MGPACQLLGLAQSASTEVNGSKVGPRGPLVSDPGGGPQAPRRTPAGGHSGEPVHGGEPRPWPEFGHRGPFHARLVAFERPRRSAPDGGSGSSGDGRKRHRR